MIASSAGMSQHRVDGDEELIEDGFTDGPRSHPDRGRPLRVSRMRDPGAAQRPGTTSANI